MYIVIWSVGSIAEDNLVDHWETFEDLPDAMEKYSQLTNQSSVCTVSVTDVIESTEAHYVS